jgi:N utilization substance protein B
MKSRHHAREVALQILYQFDLATHSANQLPPQGLELTARLRYHFEHFAVPEGLREFGGQLVAGTLAHLADLDPLIEKNASNWKVARMSSVDRSLLRMAVYEMAIFRETPHSVVIDEAIELAKQFGTSETPAFINGILDSIKTGLTDQRRSG